MSNRPDTITPITAAEFRNANRRPNQRTPGYWPGDRVIEKVIAACLVHGNVDDLLKNIYLTGLWHGSTMRATQETKP